MVIPDTRAPLASSHTAVEPVGELVERLRNIVTEFDNEVADMMSNGGGERADLWVDVDVPIGIVRQADSALTAQAADLVAAEKERDEARGRVERLQAALFFWMPSVHPDTDTGLARSAGDDAYMLAGYSGPELGPCWGDDTLAALDALKGRVAELEAGLANINQAALRAAEDATGTVPAWKTEAIIRAYVSALISEKANTRASDSRGEA